MQTRCDVCIIGGGLVGLSVAYHLSKNNYKAIILEKADRLGSEASSYNGGTTLPFNQLLNEPFLYDFVREGITAHWRLVNSGLKYGFRNIGCLYPFYEEKERVDFERRLDAIDDKEDYVFLTKEKIRASEPEFRQDIIGGVLFPNCTHGESFKLCSELEIASKKLGLGVMASCELKSFKRGSNRILSAITNRIEIEADYFVIANGAWSSQTSDALSFGIPTIPILGHMITWKPEQTDDDKRHLGWSRCPIAWRGKRYSDGRRHGLYGI